MAPKSLVGKERSNGLSLEDNLNYAEESLIFQLSLYIIMIQTSNIR